MSDSGNRLRTLFTSSREFDFGGNLLINWALAGAAEVVLRYLFSDHWSHDHNLGRSKADLRDCLRGVVVSA